MWLRNFRGKVGVDGTGTPALLFLFGLLFGKGHAALTLLLILYV